METVETFLADRAGRLDACVPQLCEGLSRSRAQQLIKAGNITVNGAAVKPNHVLQAGDEIRIRLPEPVPTGVAGEDIPLDILYEDAALLVVNKPRGMVVHPSAGHAQGTLVNALLYRVDDLSGVGGELRPGIVHRIDRMTSGLLVVAKDDQTHRALGDQFRAHSAHRTYVAVADGNFREDAGTVEAPIGRHPTDRKRMAVLTNGRGREAVTHWRVLERYGTNTLLRVSLETGRTHQIRVHMASIHHPLTGDDVYGAKKRQLGLDGQALHGYRLAFVHPKTGEQMAFCAPPPPEFLEALRRLGSDLDADALMRMLKTMEATQ